MKQMEQVQTYDRWYMHSFYFAFTTIIGCISAKAGVGINFLAFCHEVASSILRYLICTSECAQNASGGWPWQVPFPCSTYVSEIFCFFFFFLVAWSGDGISEHALSARYPCPNSIRIFFLLLFPSLIINSSHPLGSNSLGTLHKGGAFDFVIRRSSSRTVASSDPRQITWTMDGSTKKPRNGRLGRVRRSCATSQ